MHDRFVRCALLVVCLFAPMTTFAAGAARPASKRAAASPAPHAADVAAIRSAIHKSDLAADRKDLDATMAFTSPDFVSIDESGQETVHGIDEERSKLGQLFAMATKIHARTTITSIVFMADGAVVTSEQHGSVTAHGAAHTGTLRTRGTFRDFWVKTPGGWRELRSRTLSLHNTFTAHPVP